MFNVEDVVFINSLDMKYPENQNNTKFLGLIGKIIHKEICGKETAKYFFYVVEFNNNERAVFVDKEMVKIK